MYKYTTTLSVMSKRVRIELEKQRASKVSRVPVSLNENCFEGISLLCSKRDGSSRRTALSFGTCQRSRSGVLVRKLTAGQAQIELESWGYTRLAGLLKTSSLLESALGGTPFVISRQDCSYRRKTTQSIYYVYIQATVSFPMIESCLHRAKDRDCFCSCLRETC